MNKKYYCKHVYDLSTVIKDLQEQYSEPTLDIITVHEFNSGELLRIKKPLQLIRQLKEQALRGYTAVEFGADATNKTDLHVMYIADRSCRVIKGAIKTAERSF